MVKFISGEHPCPHCGNNCRWEYIDARNASNGEVVFQELNEDVHYPTGITYNNPNVIKLAIVCKKCGQEDTFLYNVDNCSTP